MPLLTAVMLAMPVVGQAEPLPKGWYQTGADRVNYETGIDSKIAATGKGSAYIKATVGETGSFGAIVQTVGADRYRGKRLKLSAKVKAKKVNGWAGLWMRVDGLNGKRAIRFDNMHERSIKGSKKFKEYCIVLDIPENSGVILFGALLNDGGQIWVDDFKLEVVGKSVPVTRPRAKPLNLDFE